MKKARWRCAITCAVLAVALLLSARLSHAAAIRDVKANSRSLIPIQTALGYSTIIELPTKPLSAVLGDQDGFKLEYVANSITLKPLVHGAKSNLFVFTDSGRYNFSVQAANPASVDYIVSIHAADDAPKLAQGSGPPEPYKTAPINRKVASAGITLRITRLRLNRDTDAPRAASLIEFELSANEKPYSFQASSIGIKQGGRFLSAESIYVDQLIVTQRNPVHGVIAVLNEEWDRRKPISIVLAISKPANTAIKKPKIIRLEVSAAPAAPRAVKKGVKNGEIELFPKVHP